MDRLFQEQYRLITGLGDRRRYLYDTIDWGLRCIGIVGARGVGKTTLMLQYLKATFGNSDKALYVTVDSPYFQTLKLYDFAQEFYQHGGETLFLDEIHKYPDWAAHIKAIYDAIPGLKIVFSGSSLLQIKNRKADLSRRAVMHHLHGLSFREFVNLTQNAQMQVLRLEELLKSHQSYAAEIIKGRKILQLFRDYLRSGYYPFFLEGTDSYPFKLRETINHILEVDLPLVTNIEVRQIVKIKKLLYMLAASLPFINNMLKLSEATGISRPKLYEYLAHMQEARLINLVRAKGQGYAILRRPEKIYLENTNMVHAITEELIPGTLRELFFVNQLKNAFPTHAAFIDSAVAVSKEGDFVIAGKYVFEVGGKGKNFKQIKDLPDSYIAADDIEIGHGNKIPLWLFGFLY